MTSFTVAKCYMVRIATFCIINSSIPKIVREILLILRDLSGQHASVGNPGTSPGTAFQSTGEHGRPQFLITEDSLRYLLEHGFSVPAISRMLRVSVTFCRNGFRTYLLYQDVQQPLTYLSIPMFHSPARVQQTHLLSN